MFGGFDVDYSLSLCWCLKHRVKLDWSISVTRMLTHNR